VTQSKVGQAKDLLETMTLHQRVAQLWCVDTSTFVTADGIDLELLADMAPYGTGCISSVHRLGGDGGQDLKKGIATVQERIMELSGHGVPALFHLDSLNGMVHPLGTQFPTPLGQAAAWQPELVHGMASIARRQLLEVGVRHSLSPVLDLARDPRWGRVHETYGEDPSLAAAMGVAFVRGLQGDDLRDGVAATAKHFLGYSFSQGGLNHGAVSLGPRILRDEFARSFEAAIREAGLATVMNSYSEIDGLPVVANEAILTELLRETLGFSGIVVSDYLSVIMLMSLHGIAAGDDEAGRLALKSGVDVELPDARGFRNLAKLVEQGEVDIALVDRAAYRVLHVKEQLGLLEPGGPRPPLVERAAGGERAASRNLAERGVVLLKNAGALPLRPSVRRVAVIGALAGSARIHYGAYSTPASVENTLLRKEYPFDLAADYIGRFVLANSGGTEEELQLFEQNVRALDPAASSVVEQLQDRVAKPTEVVVSLRGGPEGTSAADLEAARDTTTGCDIAIVVVGERTGWAGSVTAGEGRDRQTLDILGSQDELVEAVAATGVPTVVVVVSGRPLVLTRTLRVADAVVYAPLLGPEGPAAIVSVLLAETVPAGRLPITWPRCVGQVPIFAGTHKGSGYEHPDLPVPGYVDGATTPQYAFGHGLSYTTFEYGDFVVSPTVHAGGEISASVRVANTGEFDGDEVVQVYAHDRIASVTRPLRQLVAFARVPVAKRGSVEVSFRIPVNCLAFTNPAGDLVVEPGLVDVFVGASSADIRQRAVVKIEGQIERVGPERRFLSECRVREVRAE
jgi:beta-glucosidase